MNPGKNLSKYKFKRIAVESLKNCLRLHVDSILLFKHGSFASAYHLSVLALEEFAKAEWVHHYYYASISNQGFPDSEFEQKWLNLLYLHPKKQFAFIGRELFDYSPRFVKLIKSGNLEVKKQRSIYVGLERQKGKVDISSRISVPTRVKEKDPKQLISLVNSRLIDIHEAVSKRGGFYEIPELDNVISLTQHSAIFNWPYKSRLKSSKWPKSHSAYYS